MDLAGFKTSLKASTPPKDLSPELHSLWLDGRGKWEDAHNVAQDINNRNGSRIHAYLHRKEGDLSNARYWYARSGLEMPTLSIDGEWEQLVESYLSS